MEVPNLWGQLFYFIIIAVSIVFGGQLYRKRHDVPSGKKESQPVKKKRPKKKR